MRLVGVVFLIILAIVLLQKTKERAAPQDIMVTDVAKLAEKATTFSETERLEKKAKIYPRAKELVDPDGYLNTDKVTIAEHIGKNIILVDFWTYSCINCQRTIPYLNDWHEKYKDKGLVILGVHTPEFEFEQKQENVAKAIEKFDIQYPVIQDNYYKTWTAYENRYWPRKYLIDIDGFIVFDHIGEGAYQETEEKISELINERNQVLGIQDSLDIPVQEERDLKGPIFKVEDALRTPEIYFGYAFSREQLGNVEGWQPEKIVEYILPEERKRNRFYLEGAWKNNKDNLELMSDDGIIYLKWHGKEINMVAGALTTQEITYKIDKQEWKTIAVKDFILYTLLKEEQPKDHVLEIKAKKGLIAYTFTFG